MSYATLQDLIDRAGQTEMQQVAPDALGVAIDPATVDAALRHADNIVNGYVGTRYQVPLSSTPDLVRTWAVAIARHWLHRQGPPDYVVADYKDAISALKDLAGGKIALPDTAGAEPTATTTRSVLSSSPPEVWDASGLRGWRC